MITSKKNRVLTQSAYTNKKCDTLIHESNFQLFQLLLPEKFIEQYAFHSTVENKPQLIINVLNRYKFTSELSFHYAFEFGVSEEIVMKIYYDAQLAEIVYCTDLQKFKRLLGPKICPKVHKQTRSMLNAFLNRWLLYLLKNGYKKECWQAKIKQ